MFRPTILVIVRQDDGTTPHVFYSRTEAATFVTHPDRHNATVYIYEDGLRVPVSHKDWLRLAAWEAGQSVYDVPESFGDGEGTCQ